MITKALESDRPDIIEVLKRNIFDNVYLYIDVITCWPKSDFVSVWISREDGELTKVVLKYYNSFQIYVSDGGVQDYTDIAQLVASHQPAMVSGKADVIQNLLPHVKSMYKETYGVVLTQSPIKWDKVTITPELATTDDMEEIALLICSDKGIGGHYDPLELKEQLIKRHNDKFGRNYVIRQDGKIVAHYGTYAEAPGIAVMGGLIVSPDYRGNGYGQLLHSYLTNILIDENMKPVLFCHDETVLNMYLRFGAHICSRYGKLTLI